MRNKIKNSSNNPDTAPVSMSCMSRWVRMTMKLGIFPVKTNQSFTELQFNFWSLRTFLYCVTFFAIVFGGAIFLYSTEIGWVLFDIFVTTSNPVDVISTQATFACSFWMSTIPLVLASSLQSISSICLAPDLSWPKHGAKLIAALLFHVVGATFGKDIFY